MHKKINSRARQKIILNYLALENLTLNEIIDKFYSDNCRTFLSLSPNEQRTFLLEENDPNVYTHVNKEPAVLKRKLFIIEVGLKMGKKNKEEAILEITDEGMASLLN